MVSIFSPLIEMFRNGFHPFEDFFNDTGVRIVGGSLLVVVLILLVGAILK